MTSPRRTKKPASRAPRRKPRPARDFWGDERPADEGLTVIRAVDHPTALIQSRGAPPIPQGVIAQHYFDAIYERAAALAIALATSVGLSEADESH
jgi:hypothetical protein